MKLLASGQGSRRWVITTNEEGKSEKRPIHGAKNALKSAKTLVPFHPLISLGKTLFQLHVVGKQLTIPSVMKTAMTAVAATRTPPS